MVDLTPTAYVPTTYARVAHTNGYEFSQGTGYVLPEYAAVVPDAVHTGAVEHHRILIIGGGITGLTLACSLAQLGVHAVLLDEDNTVGVKGASSRGICYTQKSLEIFDKLGIFDRIKNKGVEWSVGRTFAGADEIYSFDLKKQNNFSLSQQPAFINIQQFYNEGYLVERIGQLNQRVRAAPIETSGNLTPDKERTTPDNGVQIRWNNRITGFSQDKQVATFTIATSAGNYTATADYVVDATGSRSPFRDWLNIQVTAKKGDDRWCIADVRFNTQPPIERHTWIEAPFNDNRAVWQHLMADRVWRIDYQMPPDADPEYMGREDVVRERLQKQFGKDVQVDIVWVGPYAYRSECVDRMVHTAGKSQIFLIGDSAKVVSPFGARGGNTGIADADNLAWKLAAVVQGRAAPALLASYHTERHEAATTNVEVTNRTARFLRPADGMERLFRTATIDLAKKHAFARALVNTGRMAVANPYSASPLSDPGLGASISVQNVAFSWANGSAGCLNDLLRWAQGHCLLLVFSDASVPQLPAAQAAQMPAAQAAQMPAVQAAQLRVLAHATGTRIVLVSTACTAVREQVIDKHQHLAQACGFLPTDALAKTRWALLRPDSYVAARGHGVNNRLTQAIARCTGA